MFDVADSPYNFDKMNMIQNRQGARVARKINPEEFPSLAFLLRPGVQQNSLHPFGCVNTH